MAGNSTDPGRSVTSKVTAILMAFTDDAVLTLTEIASTAQLPSSTAHRLASELVVWHLLERTANGSYRIGLPLRIIANDPSDFEVLNRAVLVMRAQPVLAELARTVRTDAKLGVLQGDEVRYLSQSGQRPTDMAHLVPRFPAHATAVGKALLAFSPTSVVDRVLSTGMPTTKVSAASDKLRQALSTIRITHIATARDAYQVDRFAIAMPVFSGGGKVTAAIELTIREPDTDREAAVGALIVACRSLSRQLGTESPAWNTMRCNENGSTGTS
jgi:DNA-binding IclR family transcriptional regulator